MQTEIVAGDRATARAAELLRAGEVVALPTETVYGLAADALNAEAVAKIFEAKDRPKFDPLIVHLPNAEWWPRIANVDEAARALAEKFWPGPLTIVLPRQEIVPDIVTAGLETVAARISAHPAFAEIIRALDRPLAAPSANRFGRISATSASAVFDELNGRIPLIVDGGPTPHGIESTIVRVRGGAIEILRTGPITAEALSSFGKVVHRTFADTIIAPGQMASHYAPQTRLIVVESLTHFSSPTGKRVGTLSFRAGPSGVEESRGSTSKVAPRDPSTLLGMTGFAATRVLSECGDLREAAANLFRMLRELDAAGLDVIVAELVAEEGIGIAINDRLRRASSRAKSRDPAAKGEGTET